MNNEKKQQQDTNPKAANASNPSQYAGYYPGSPHLPALELARAYIPIQRLGQINPPPVALETGTLFPELYRPYHVKVGR